jgi:hypothetical protein
MPKKPSDEVMRSGFENALNRQGFPFQHAVLREGERIRKEGTSPWTIDVEEFPVRIRERETRIDFILKHANAEFYLIAECKRANPGLDWCFVRAPYLNPQLRPEHVCAERLSYSPTAALSLELALSVEKLIAVDNAFHISFEKKSGAKGDCQGQEGRGAIETAVTQALRGTSGYLQHFITHRKAMRAGAEVDGTFSRVVLPVVFTTARLLTSTVDLRETDLESGNVQVPFETLNESGWIIYQYHRSLSFRPELPRPAVMPPNMREALFQEFLRSVAIVSPTGIAEFLHWASHLGK